MSLKFSGKEKAMTQLTQLEERGQGVEKTVTVRTNGSTKTVPFTEGLTVSAAVQAAEIHRGFRTKLFVDGNEASDNDVVAPGATVTVAPRIRNGGE